jgi:hypothetical protein
VGGVAGIMMLAASAADSAELAAFDLETSADLAALCGAEPDDPNFSDARQFCFGFVSGVSLFYTTALQADRIKKVVCTDEQLTREQLRANFVAWQAEHPEYADASPLDGFVRSAVNRWPCKE